MASNSILSYFPRRSSAEKNKEKNSDRPTVHSIIHSLERATTSEAAVSDVDSIGSEDLVSQDLSDQDSDDSHHPGVRASTSDSVSEPPCKRRKHDFMESWSKSRPWLRFDSEKNVMYCDWCLHSKKKNTFTTGCRNFRTSTLDRHVSLPCHKEAVQDISLRKEFQSSHKTAVDRKTESLTSSLHCVYWMAKENLPSSKYSAVLDLLDFEGVDVQSMSVGKNASYHSRATVEEFQESLFEVLESELVDKVKNSQFFSILCDESTDISNTKKLIIYMRLIDSDTFVASTHFLGNVTVEGSSCTAVVLFDLIMNFLQDKGIDLSTLIGFGSDGASVMTGRISGVATRFKQKCPHLVSIHCMAHRLNLCTSQASTKVEYLKNMEGTFTDLYKYFRQSANRTSELKDIQKVLDSPELKIKEVHEIRWLAFNDALWAVFHSYQVLVTYFRKNRKLQKERELLEKLLDYRFVAAMHMMMDIIPHLAQLCLLLQKSDLDIAAIKPAIQATLSSIQRAESGTTHYQSEMKGKLKKTTVGEKVTVSFKDIELSIHRSTLQKATDDITAMRKAFTSELKDQISSRFPVESQNIADAFEVLGLRSLTFLSSDEVDSYGTAKIVKLSEHFGKEKNVNGITSPALIDPVKVLPEWSLLKTIVKQERYPRDKMQELWKLVFQHHKETFPNLLRLAAIALVMPYHTADCERGFSEQNRTKNSLRNRLEQHTLQRLMMINLEGPHMREFDFNKALSNWKSKKERRVFPKAK